MPRLVHGVIFCIQIIAGNNSYTNFESRKSLNQAVKSAAALQDVVFLSHYYFLYRNNCRQKKRALRPLVI